ncbi:uncharacterized protein LOC108607354 isoform X2 [Drosophila busckii]|uniref:uncharacterized protein LOC108607354 isoform X2 n=1 Tax=Drosophila busckii TaxID=30019 RepID=UPI00083F477F|nr:uncharacterized protein LOC108607354 isoform X2 [Drosophila busckii]
MITAMKDSTERDHSCSFIKPLDLHLDESDDDEERELTNLNWLLRNQNLTWPNTIEASSEDESKGSMKSKSMDWSTARKATNKYISARNLIVYPESKKNVSKTIDPNLLTGTTQHSKRLSPSERYDIFINKLKCDLVEYEKGAVKYKTDVNEKPPFNYSHIIGMAMLENGRVTLQQICSWIESKFAFFRNSIRHNLSLHHCFRNQKREEKGKGGYWELGVDLKKCDRKRVRNRKAAQLKTKPKRLNQVNAKTEKERNLLEQMENNRKIHVQGETLSSTSDIKSMQLLYRKHPHAKADTLSNEEMGMSIESVLEMQQEVRPTHFREQCLTLSGTEVGLELPSPSSRNQLIDTNSEETLLCPSTDVLESMGLSNSECVYTQQQYELGTIIISTTGIIDESFSLNKFSCPNMIYADDEIPLASENVIISSNKSTDVHATSVHMNASDITRPEVPSSLTINCDYSNFRPYMDGLDIGIEEPFDYLHNNEISRNEDILDNLLDVCVRDY